MSKEDLKINPVDQDVTKEDLKKVNGGHGSGSFYCPSDDSCPEEGGESLS